MSPGYGLDSTLLLPHEATCKVPTPILPTENMKPKGSVCVSVCMYMHVCMLVGGGGGLRERRGSDFSPACWIGLSWLLFSLLLFDVFLKSIRYPKGRMHILSLFKAIRQVGSDLYIIGKRSGPASLFS